MMQWQKIYATGESVRAYIVKSLLEEKELKPVLLNKKDSVYQIGNYEIYVLQENVLKAIKTIADETGFE